MLRKTDLRSLAGPNPTTPPVAQQGEAAGEDLSKFSNEEKADIQQIRSNIKALTGEANSAAPFFRDLSHYAAVCKAVLVYQALGSGHYEDIYRSALAVEFRDYGPREEVKVAVGYKGACVGVGRADIILDRVPLIIELKTVAKLSALYEAQLKAYMRTMGIRRGLLVNFGPEFEAREVLL